MSLIARWRVSPRAWVSPGDNGPMKPKLRFVDRDGVRLSRPCLIRWRADFFFFLEKWPLTLKVVRLDWFRVLSVSLMLHRLSARKRLFFFLKGKGRKWGGYGSLTSPVLSFFFLFWRGKLLKWNLKTLEPDHLLSKTFRPRPPGPNLIWI